MRTEAKFPIDAINCINHIHRICVPTTSNFVRTTKIHKHSLDKKNMIADQRRYRNINQAWDNVEQQQGSHSRQPLLTNFDIQKLTRFENKHGISFNYILNESVCLNLRHTHFQPHNLTLAEWKGLRD